MSKNKKILGASKHIYNNIEFKSKLEVDCYKLLIGSNLPFSYEGEKITILEGFKPTITIYAPTKIQKGMYSKDLLQVTSKVRDITFLPDFLIIKDNYRIYFDVKGMPNDTYPIKKKLFLKELERRNDGFKYMFFEPHSIYQMKQAIKIIQDL